MTDFLPPTLDPPLLLLRLGEVCENLKTLYEQLAFTRRTELELRTQAYQASQQDSHAARARDAELASTHATVSVWELEATINGLKEEKYYLLQCLEWAKE